MTTAPLTVHRGTRDGTGAIARPIQIPWTCAQTGDCCRAITSITVTKAEREVLESHSAFATRGLEFEVHPDEKGSWTPWFYQLLTPGGCPFLSNQNLCTIHASRPYNCRRFMCGRVDVTAESYESGGPMGCYNLSDRVTTSLRFQEHFSANMRRAQKDWALSHGWKK